MARLCLRSRVLCREMSKEIIDNCDKLNAKVWMVEVRRTNSGQCPLECLLVTVRAN